jgi:prepilin-type N-terminal cleavage/methylation domain-containing protein
MGCTIGNIPLVRDGERPHPRPLSREPVGCVLARTRPRASPPRAALTPCPSPASGPAEQRLHPPLATRHSPLPTRDSPLATPHSPLTTRHSPLPAHRGLTLIELLVVISIMVLLTVFALPVITPSGDTRKIREAARSVNVYLGAARNRAMETGRPCGVLFERRQGQTQASTTLLLAEVPLPYGGAQTTSRIVITPTTGTSATVSFTPTEDPVGAQIVKVGDRLQLNYCGHFWTITGIGGSTWSFSSMTATIPPVTPAGGLPFTFTRRPMRASAAPLQLPTNMVVDTQWSGVGVDTSSGRTDTFKPASDTDPNPVMVMFSPKGEVDSVYCTYGGSYGAYRPTESMYLLIGRQDRVPPSLPEDGRANWQDTSNLWVTVNPQTGLLKTVEVRNVTTGYVAARGLAVSGSSMGGK